MKMVARSVCFELNMKRFLPFLALLVATPRPSLAQPEIEPRLSGAGSRFKLSEDNLDALSFLGRFFNTVKHAQNYQAEFGLAEYTTKDGRPLAPRGVYGTSGWTSKGDGFFLRRRAILTVYEYHKDEREWTLLDDGTTSYRSLALRHSDMGYSTVWSQQPQEPSPRTDFSLDVVNMVWSRSLAAFGEGLELKRQERLSREKKPLIVFSNDQGFEAAFDKETGFLQDWTMKKNDNTTELHFLFIKVNQPLNATAPSKIEPKGDKQVAPAETEEKVRF